MADPLIEHIKRKHHLVKQSAWQDPEQRDLLEGFIGPDDTVEIVKMRKASPLIDRSQNPVVGRMNAPAAAPVDHQAGRSTGTQMDVSPASSVPGIRHSHRHRHSDGTDFADHLHAHNHVVRHDADADMEAGDDHHFPLKPTFLGPNYPKIAELAKHAAAMREIAETHRDFHARTHAKEAVEADLAQIQKLVAKGLLTKAARSPRISPAEVATLGNFARGLKAARVDAGDQGDIQKASPLADQTRSSGRPAGTRLNVAPARSMLYTRHSHLHEHSDDTGNYQHEHPHDHPVRHSAADEMDSAQHDHHSPENKVARLRRLAAAAADHPDPLVRRGGRELAKAAEVAEAKFIAHGRLVTKAQSPGLDAERLGSLVKAAVDQAMRNLDRHIDDLNRRRQ